MKFVNPSQKEKPLLSIKITEGRKTILVMGDITWKEVNKLIEKGTQLEFPFQ